MSSARVLKCVSGDAQTEPYYELALSRLPFMLKKWKGVFLAKWIGAGVEKLMDTQDHETHSHSNKQAHACGYISTGANSFVPTVTVQAHAHKPQ